MLGRRSPGTAVIGMLLVVVGGVLAVRAKRNRLPLFAARTALAVGVVLVDASRRF